MSGSKLNVLNQKSRLLPYGQHKGMLMCCGCAKMEQPLPRCWLPYAVNAENKFVLQGRLSCMKSEMQHSLMSPDAASSKSRASEVAADTGGAEAT